MFHREFPVADGDDTEVVPVRVPVERSDGTSVTGDLLCTAEQRGGRSQHIDGRRDGHVS